MPRYKMSDLIVVLPGIAGSVLKKDGKTVWGYSSGTIARALLTLGSSIEVDLALPGDDPTVDDLGDGIVAEALMPDLHLLPGIWKIDGYGRIAEAIKSAFEVAEGRNFFTFPYDWRRDNRVAARRLQRAAQNWLASWRQASGNPAAKLILIGHSMGGLVSRYYLECLEGWRDTRALVTFGTPYRGSLNALNGLANGIRKGRIDLSAMARQFTALYQLLPIYECYDPGDGGLVRVGETAGIPNVDPEKAAAALAFHREIEAAVEANEQLAEYRAGRYAIHPVVGVAQETNQSARRNGEKVTMLRTYKGTLLDGDGTVPQVSAIPLELSQSRANAMYAGTQHGSLQNADAVISHLIGVLSGQSLNLGAFKKGSQVALEVEDLFFAGEPVVVLARPGNPNAKLSATLWHPSQGQPLASVEMQAGDGDWQRVEFAPPGSGAYRVAVTGSDVHPAEDSLVVLEDSQDVRP
jgi:pimeloyl-ACP methyl ester carboxylesterase